MPAERTQQRLSVRDKERMPNLRASATADDVDDTPMRPEAIQSRADSPFLRLPENELKKIYEAMVATRMLDERNLKLQRSGRIGFCVTSLGEEATQICTAAALSQNDWLFPSYRQYGAALYRGESWENIMHQCFGSVKDRLLGRQMPVHYSDKAHKFVSVSSVIGTQIIQGVGAAMAARIKGDESVVATYMGDGATSSNDFHSAMTFAGVFKAPALLICVNNRFAISLPIEKQCAAETLADKAKGYGMVGVRVDGNDPVAVYEATWEAAQRARRGDGPTFLELITYRQGPHSSSDDPSRYRKTRTEEEFERQDPIRRMETILETLGYWSENYGEKVRSDITNALNAAITEAQATPQPAWETMFDDVWAERPEMLEAQCQDLMAHEEGLELKHAGEFPL